MVLRGHKKAVSYAKFMNNNEIVSASVLFGTNRLFMRVVLIPCALYSFIYFVKIMIKLGD